MAPGNRSVAEVFRELGYDVSDADEMRALADSLRWLDQRRRAQAAARTQRWAMLGAFILAVVGSAGTLLVQWLAAKFLNGNPQ